MKAKITHIDIKMGDIVVYGGQYYKVWEPVEKGYSICLINIKTDKKIWTLDTDRITAVYKRQ